tara:strand:- start:344 stop:1165 length:822 start_codon:yes stop_codon:yes gene_type:complete
MPNFENPLSGIEEIDDSSFDLEEIEDEKLQEKTLYFQAKNDFKKSLSGDLDIFLYYKVRDTSGKANLNYYLQKDTYSLGKVKDSLKKKEIILSKVNSSDGLSDVQIIVSNKETLIVACSEKSSFRSKQTSRSMLTDDDFIAAKYVDNLGLDFSIRYEDTNEGPPIIVEMDAKLRYEKSISMKAFLTINILRNILSYSLSNQKLFTEDAYEPLLELWKENGGEDPYQPNLEIERRNEDIDTVLRNFLRDKNKLLDQMEEILENPKGENLYDANN